MRSGRFVWGLLCGLAFGCGDDDGKKQQPATDAGSDAAQVERDGSPEPEKDAGDEDPDAGEMNADAGADSGSEGDSGSGHLVEMVVGSEGATVAASNGVEVEIPAGAVPSNVTITIDEIMDVPAPEGATSVGPTIQLGPEGTTFDMPVKVTLPWSGGDLPVVVAHSPKGGTSWTPLSGGSDETRVWGYTDGFSWFQPVYYQGAADAPVVLDSERPISAEAVALGSAPTVVLYGTGFRTDTVVTLFKDGVTTADVSSVSLKTYGLQFTIPDTFTLELGLLTIQAKNPQAEMGDAIGINVIETPVLSGLSPSVIEYTESEWNDPQPTTVNVSATKLPNDFSVCRADVFIVAGPTIAAPAYTSGAGQTQTGFSFSLDRAQLSGEHEVRLICGDVVSNSLKLDIQQVPDA